MQMRLLVTGGAGFIGSNFVHHVLKAHQSYEIIVLDKLTYAGRKENLQDIWDKITFIQGDITRKEDVEKSARGSDCIVNFAAETHVDRSILDAGTFVLTDVLGVYNLLEAARKFNVQKFVQISTDEVYGDILTGSFKESDRLNPRNPYSASKAGAELLCRSYFETYGLFVTVTRSSNNYGPNQHPEKLIPKTIIHALLNKPIPVYGTGKNIRDWLYVEDTCRAIDLVLRDGKIGEVYNISGGSKKTNIEIAEIILKELNKPKELIKFVKDRPGHDRRYSIDGAKLERLGFVKKFVFEDAMKKTIDWYRQNRQWWEKIKSGDFKNYYKKQYAR